MYEQQFSSESKPKKQHVMYVHQYTTRVTSVAAPSAVGISMAPSTHTVTACNSIEGYFSLTMTSCS
eukprot:scaffold259369_cov32-Tisochrysis_lutea.AAC.1